MGYRFNFLVPEHPYYAAWREMRRRRAWIGWSLLGLLFSFGLAFAVTTVSLSEVAFVLCFVAAFLPFLVAYFRFHFWPCPRCGKAFFVDWVGFHPFTDECRRCDLPLYAPCDPARQEWE